MIGEIQPINYDWPGLEKYNPSASTSMSACLVKYNPSASVSIKNPFNYNIYFNMDGLGIKNFLSIILKFELFVYFFVALIFPSRKF